MNFVSKLYASTWKDRMESIKLLQYCSYSCLYCCSVNINENMQSLKNLFDSQKYADPWSAKPSNFRHINIHVKVSRHLNMHMQLKQLNDFSGFFSFSA